jgi:recombination protein RecA
VQQNIIEKSGAWFSYKGDRIGQGKENAREFLLNNKDIAADIEKQIRARVLPGKAPVQVVEEEGAALQA